MRDSDGMFHGIRFMRPTEENKLPPLSLPLALPLDPTSPSRRTPNIILDLIFILVIQPPGFLAPRLLLLIGSGPSGYTIYSDFLVVAIASAKTSANIIIIITEIISISISISGCSGPLMARALPPLVFLGHTLGVPGLALKCIRIPAAAAAISIPPLVPPFPVAVALVSVAVLARARRRREDGLSGVNVSIDVAVLGVLVDVVVDGGNTAAFAAADPKPNVFGLADYCFGPPMARFVVIVAVSCAIRRRV